MQERPMKRLFPTPYLSLVLFGLWLVLNQSLTPGHLLIGFLLGILGPLWSASLRPSRVVLHNWPAAVRLTLAVGRDVLASNLQVARGVWRAGRRPPRSRFVRIPLQLRDANGLAALAIITTVVPGTVWSELAMDRSELLLHLFDVDDEQAYVRYFKERYEKPLMEIFE
jgi:multicomponent K+:H+ antiporter subunit E